MQRSRAAIRLAGFVMAAIGLAGYVLWALDGNLVRDGHWIGVDFHVYYQAARVLQRGGDIYTAGIAPPYVYPPVLAALVMPLASLPVDVATMLWKLLQHLCLVGAGVLLVSLVPARGRPPAGGLLCLGLLTVPVRDEIQVGESNSLVLLLVMGAVWLVARTDRRGTATGGPAIAAGVLLALAVSIKVLPVLLVAYFWWRGPRRVAGAATAGFLALQALMLAFTPSTAAYWLQQFPGLFGQAFPYLDNQSLNAFVARATLPAPDPGMPSSQLFDGEAIRPALTWAFNLLALTGATWVLWKSRAHSRTVNGLLLSIGLVMLVTHLVSGSTWLHHLVDLCVPLAGLLVFAWPRPRSMAAFWIGVAVIYGALMVRSADWVGLAERVAPGSAPLALLAGSLPMFGVIALGAWVSAALLSPEQETDTPGDWFAPGLLVQKDAESELTPRAPL